MMHHKKLKFISDQIEETDMLAKDMLYDRRVDIQKIDDLPPLPVIANELLAALNDSDAEIEDISKIILKDPGLTAKLLGLANSAFFSFGRPVGSIPEAIINVLGLELVKGLSIGLIMSNSFDVNKCKGFDIARYWSNALLTATLTRDIAKISNLKTDINPGFFYLYGLLHNLGILVLADCFPEEMSDVFLAQERDPDTRLVSIEEERMGVNHHQAGLHIGVKWNLPTDVSQAMMEHSNFDYRGEFYEVTQLTGYCSRICQNWLHNSHIEPKNDLIPSLLNISLDECNQVIEATHAKIEDVNSIAATMNK